MHGPLNVKIRTQLPSDVVSCRRRTFTLSLA